MTESARRNRKKDGSELSARKCRLGASLLGLFSSICAGDLPGALRTLRLRLVTVRNAIILIGFADRAQGFVIQAGQPQSFFELFRELVQRFEVIGCSRNFRFAGFQELLI